jgi:NTP pyrophosphatase (non-canonical NTP hydrolase)
MLGRTTNSSGSGSVTLDEISEHVRVMHEQQGWPERSPQERMLYLVSEMGELSQALIGINDDALDEGRLKDAIGDELADIVWNVCAMAQTLKLDFNSAIRQKLVIMSRRKWE